MLVLSMLRVRHLRQNTCQQDMEYLCFVLNFRVNSEECRCRQPGHTGHFQIMLTRFYLKLYWSSNYFRSSAIGCMEYNTMPGAYMLRVYMLRFPLNVTICA